ncbi:ABC transporter ATP-binding protein [Propionimicrobium lymphophilum]|uniref:ABC transporter ATP-binding protein n=1 Tax=Propionimicrobium lymphophilum TaxID=33012 RepID=UPI00040C24A4|nr:ABC transporter ATP-binding protein [Propionimicrobium lymphophilum]
MLLETRNLTKKFVRRAIPFAAVDDVNFTLGEGDFTAIVGRSGNGKTTFLNLVTGLLKPTSGTVTVEGKNVHELKDAHLSKLRNRTLGFVPQRMTLIGSLNVLDNVILPAVMDKDWRKRDEKLFDRALQLLEKVDVAELSQAFPRELSGGEMRRIGLARALMNHPEALICDEPTGDLDAESTEIVLGVLKEQAEQGTGVLVVTHDDAAVRAADNVWRMDKGRLAPDQ